jgi:hypothetical protein
VEFAMVAPLAIVVTLAVAQFALFLYERNVVMGSLSEGARVATSTGRSIADGQLTAAKLLRESLGSHVASAVVVRSAVEDGLAVLRTDATLPSFVPGLPGLRIHMTASMHREDDLGGAPEPPAPLSSGALGAPGLESATVPGLPPGSRALGATRAALETRHRVAPEANGLRR